MVWQAINRKISVDGSRGVFVGQELELTSMGHELGMISPIYVTWTHAAQAEVGSNRILLVQLRVLNSNQINSLSLQDLGNLTKYQVKETDCKEALLEQL